MNYGPGNRNDPSTLPDEKIIENAVAARDAGDRDDFVYWVRVFVARRLPLVKAMVARKIGPDEGREDVVQDALASALSSVHTIKGKHTGEFVNWLKTIVSRRIADHFDQLVRERKQLESADGKPSGDEDAYLREIADLEDQYGELDLRDAIGRTLSSHSETHQRAIRLRIEGHPSKDVAAILGEDSAMTPANVDKIYSRFRKKLRAELDRIDQIGQDQ